jgi:hypothetical protein
LFPGKALVLIPLTFQLPVVRFSEEELLALLMFRKLITEASAGSLGDELGRVSRRLGSLPALLQGKLLTFFYYSPAASTCTIRTVEPHHMVSYMGNWHLIAFCH